jgi:uncharacterized damage-inducible protein DinB
MTLTARIFEHNDWSNLRIIGACSGLTEEQLAWTSTGSYGSVVATLVHLVAAQQRYAHVFKGGPIPTEPAERVHERDPFPGFDRLRTSAEASGGLLREAAEAPDPDRTMTRVYRGQEERLPAWVLLLQAINHATEHRTNITSILAEHGVEVADIDGWTYLGEVAGG